MDEYREKSNEEGKKKKGLSPALLCFSASAIVSAFLRGSRCCLCLPLFIYIVYGIYIYTVDYISAETPGPSSSLSFCIDVCCTNRGLASKAKHKLSSSTSSFFFFALLPLFFFFLPCHPLKVAASILFLPVGLK